jgi:hypothetical protein
MRKAMAFILAASLLLGAGYAMAQEEGKTPQPGQTQLQETMIGGQDMPQVMKQMQDTMQQMQQMMAKGKMAPADLKKMQDMFNQMQVMMNQMQMMHMMQMCRMYPMMKQTPQTQGQTQAPAEHPKQPEPEKR